MRKYLASFVAAAGFLLTSLPALPALADHQVLPATPTTIAVYARAIRHVNPQMPDWQSRLLAQRVLANAERWRIDANILVAIVTVESSWHTHAVSSAGAIGLGQLMPGTAAGLGVDPRDPSQNISGAARYLSGLMHKFGSNNYQLVFAAYNAGPQAVREYGGIPPFDETQRYVVKVLRALSHLRRTVHLPADLAISAHGPDVDYWLDGDSY
ncbi:MAG TPA: lytic transglycosylase domain-containing protein [Verrucomicrobiae bacterium]|nr:lytic transglycosylase domain-containing protein [Verrucomicrobiae bacterium]